MVTSFTCTRHTPPLWTCGPIWPSRRDVLVLLGVVDRQHAIDPRLDARPFGADAVFIPAEDIDDLVQRRGIDGLGDDLVAAEFIVDLSEPARAAVHLIAAHVRTTRHAQAANLDAAVDHAGLRIAAAL